MSIRNLFSKRQKRLRGETPDVFVYDKIPEPLRIQVVEIWKDTIGIPRVATFDVPVNEQAYRLYFEMCKALCREYGVFRLVENPSGNPLEHLGAFLLSSDDHERVLDVIELSFQQIDTVVRRPSFYGDEPLKLTPDSAIEELNARFLEHGIGYQYHGGQIVRLDSEIIHSEVVRPALQLLADRRYQGANDEFLTAHEHYRHGRYKECLNECLKAFESTMKSICQIRGWTYSENNTAKRLIGICLQNGLVPLFLETQMNALRALLESGIPTVRHKLGGHGQGTEEVKIPSYYASYMLHMTATTIKFTVEAEQNHT